MGEGLLLVLLNIPITMIIFSTPTLRVQKEFIIFAFSMVFDAIFGFTYFYCGVFRLYFYYTEKCEFEKNVSLRGRLWYF